MRQAADSNRLLSSAQSETEQIRAQMEAELEQEKGKVVSLNKSLADEIHEWSSKLASEKEASSKLRERCEEFEEEKRKEEEQRFVLESALAEAKTSIARLKRDKEQEMLAGQQSRDSVIKLQEEAVAQAAAGRMLEELHANIAEKANLQPSSKGFGQHSIIVSGSINQQEMATQLARQLKEEKAALVALGEQSKTTAITVRLEQERLSSALSNEKANSERLVRENENLTAELNAIRSKFEGELKLLLQRRRRCQQKMPYCVKRMRASKKCVPDRQNCRLKEN